jgi:hypothetical protein
VLPATHVQATPSVAILATGVIHSAQLRGERVKIVVGFAFCSSR